MERLDLVEQAEESGLVANQPAQNRLAIRLFADCQPLEPTGPAVRKGAELPFISPSELRITRHF